MDFDYRLYNVYKLSQREVQESKSLKVVENEFCFTWLSILILCTLTLSKSYSWIIISTSYKFFPNFAQGLKTISESVTYKYNHMQTYLDWTPGYQVSKKMIVFLDHTDFKFADSTSCLTDMETSADSRTF